MASTISFVDGFNSATEPTRGIVSTSAYKTFSSDALYVSDKGSAAANGDVYYNTTTHLVRRYVNGAWADDTGGGGGGGGSAVWVPGAVAPTEELEYSQSVWKFTLADAGTQKLYLDLKVPTSYTAGKPVKMYISHYSPASANTQLLTAVATLVRTGTDAVDSTTNQRTTTNTAITNTVAKQLRQVELDLSDSSGSINSVAISQSDLIRIELYRGTCTDVEDIRFIPSATEVTFT